MQDRINISTHSLTRRLTDIGWHGHKSDDISTHSLTRRLTKILCTMQRKYGISTHSLTRRLTPHPLLLSKFVANFNSQPHKEADHLLLYFCVSFQHFNSQPHKEADDEFPDSCAACFISTHSLTRRLTAISDKNIFIQN